MKVVVACDVLGEKNNGTSMAAYNLIDSLKAKGHEVIVICNNEDKKDWENFYITKSLNLGPLNQVFKNNGVCLARPSKEDKEMIRNIIKDADVVHCLLPFSLGINCCKIAKELEKPVTISFHCQAENITAHLGGMFMNMKSLNNKVYKVFYKNVYQYVDAVHYPTQFIRDTFEKVVGPTNGYVISNGVNKYVRPLKADKPEEIKDKFLILSTGRLGKEKRQGVLLRAIAQSKYNDKIQVILAGAGPFEKRLSKYAKKHIANMPIIKFFSREEMINLLNYADLYVHPAEIELEGIACLEACVCGCVPIVSDSDRAATKNFALDERNLFKLNDSADLAKKIDYWIENEQERKKCKENYINFSKIFDQEECMDKMEQMLKDVIELNKKNIEEKRKDEEKQAKLDAEKEAEKQMKKDSKKKK